MLFPDGGWEVPPEGIVWMTAPFGIEVHAMQNDPRPIQNL